MQSATTTTITTLLPGSTWIVTLKQKQWPIVLCRDEFAPPRFIALRQDANHLPAIQLGRQKYIWVHADALQEAFEPNKNYMAGLKPHDQPEVQPGDSDALKEEKQRRKAFREDARHLHDDKFWYNYIINRSELRKLGQKKKHQIASQRKRSGPVIDLERDDRLCWSTPVKRQKFSQGRAPVANMMPFRPSIKRKHDSVTDAIEISDDNSDSDETEDELFVSPLHRKGKGPTRAISDDCGKIYKSIELDDPFISLPDTAPPGPHQCKLIFPKGGTLVVDKKVIANCHYLLSRSCDDEHATELDLSHDKRAKEANIQPSDISAVTRHFLDRDLGPRLVNTSSDPPALSQVDLTSKKKQTHAETLSKAFVAAVKIQDENLQDLVLVKLRALGSLPPLSAIIVAKSVASLPAPATETQKDMTMWATSCLAQCFWALARDCGEALQSLLEENDGMRVAIFDELKVNSQGGKMGFD